MKNSIEVINLSKSYKTKKAVNNISFKIDENEIVGLLGPNGCGKTTTIGMILGLLKPTSGQVLINGKNIENNKISILHKMNFISPYIELPKKLTVNQNLIVYGKLYNIQNLNERINFLSEKLRLGDLLDKITGELSSGQKNRVSLAKALINDPTVLLLDGLLIISLFSFNFSFKIKFLTLVLLIISSLLLIKTSTLKFFSSSLTIKLMLFSIKYNINTKCACSSTG